MKKNSSLASAFDESIQIKTQFKRVDGKLKIVRCKVITNEIKQAKKQLFPISKERK